LAGLEVSTRIEASVERDQIGFSQTTMTPRTTLAFDHVSRDFSSPGGGSYRVIDDVSLTLREGAFTALVGPSGCGKSTLLNLAAGLLRPTSGTIRVEGEPLPGLNQHATYMFQDDALLPWKDVRANVMLGLTLAGMPRVDAEARTDAWIRRIGLTAFASHFPAQLSGGMRKRVSMAQNWILGRSQVLMDEPFSALDVHTRHLMETELLALWDALPDAASRSPVNVNGPGTPVSRARRTVLFVTHDLEEAIALADDVVVLSAGPASHIVARHAIDLERPRNLLDLRTSRAFEALYRELWSVLREEVVRSQQAGADRG
jgi:NitT/TauT family transport system ATP-binding protein